MDELKFKEYFTEITGETIITEIGLRIFLHLANKALNNMEKEYAPIERKIVPFVKEEIELLNSYEKHAVSLLKEILKINAYSNKQYSDQWNAEIFCMTFRREKHENFWCNKCDENKNNLVSFWKNKNKITFCVECLNILTKSVNEHESVKEREKNNG